MKKEFIEAVYLLSAEEWEAIVANVPNVPVELGNWWWLRTPGKKAWEVFVVQRNGELHEFAKWYGHGGVRPAFKVPPAITVGNALGTKINIEKLPCTIVGKDTVLSDVCIDTHRFDEFFNDYEESEICDFLKSKEFEKLLY